MLGDARSSVAGVSEAASAGPALPNEAGSSRRRIQVIGVRVIEGRVGLFHILIFKGQNSWLVWRSKEQLLSLREELCLNAPGVSVPHLPSAMSGGAGLMLTGGEDSARQMAAFRRHKELVCAWLDILNDTPLLQDSSQFLKFLDDHHDTAPESSSVPVVGSVKCSGQQIKNINPPLHPSESDKFNENPLENNNKNIDAPKAHSTLKKLKSFFKRKHGSSTSALLDVTSETVAVVGDAFTFADEIENCSSSYEAWLRQKQSEYGFSGDSFETFEFTNIDKEQQAQSKDSGSANGFKLRGQNYKVDGKKIAAGQPLSRLLCMESYRVDITEKDADGKDIDRHDHVATRGICRNRVDAILCLRDPPFLFIMNFQLPGDPPISMVSYFAIPGNLARNLGIVSYVPAAFLLPKSGPEEPIQEDVLKAMRLFEEFCDFPKNEYERLALWGIEGEEEDKCVYETDTSDRHEPGVAIVVNDIELEGSVCSDGWSSSQRSGVELSGSHYSAGDERATSGGKRYKKALRKEAEAREKQSFKRVNSLGLMGASSEQADHSKRKTLLQRIGLASTSIRSNDIAMSDDASSQDPITAPETAATTNLCTNDCRFVNEIGNIPAPDSISVTSERSGASKKSSTSKNSKNSSKSSWKMPSDICWADPHEKGVFPPEDVRNKRFKLTPLVVEGPWVVKAAVPTQPAVLGQKVVIRYFRGNGYVEADIHVGSSIIASQVVGLLRGYAKHFVSEVGVTLQGENKDELPEKLFASIILVHPDPTVNRSIEIT